MHLPAVWTPTNTFTYMRTTPASRVARDFDAFERLRSHLFLASLQHLPLFTENDRDAAAFRGHESTIAQYCAY
jgi:hypothetical protein